MHGATAQVTYSRDYPVTVNHAAPTSFAGEIARSVSGTQAVNPNAIPVMGGEDFAFMLKERPGAIVFVGNGDSARLHHPAYDFNDAVIPAGISYWARLVETAMPA